MSPRRAFAYVFVLSVTLVAVAAAAVALGVRRARLDRARATASLIAARVAAPSAVEAGLQSIADEGDNWRDTVDPGDSRYAEFTLGDADLDVDIMDWRDDDLDDDTGDPARLVGRATVGDASAALSVIIPGDQADYHNRALLLGPLFLLPLDNPYGSLNADDLMGRLTGTYSAVGVAGFATDDKGRPAPVLGSAASFVRVPHDARTLVKEFTLSFRVRASTSNSTTRGVIMKSALPATGTGGLIVTMNRTTLTVAASTPSRTATLTYALSSTSAWYTITIRGCGDAGAAMGLCLFVDGQSVRTNSSLTGGFSVGASGMGNTQPWYIGAQVGTACASGCNPLTGSLKDVAFYDRALADDEIEWLATNAVTNGASVNVLGVAVNLANRSTLPAPPAAPGSWLWHTGN